MSLVEKFWNRMAEGYSKQPVADEAAYQKKLQITREYFPADSEVLELGCGTGSTAIEHAPYVKHIEAVDISSKMIEIAEAKAKAKDINNITFKISAIDSFSLPAQTVDVILALSILHLVGNKKEVIANAYKILKPGGVFVSSTVCLGNTMKLLKLVAPAGKLFGLTIKIFTTQQLIECITDAGFEIDYQWQAGSVNVAFIVAKKPAVS